MWSQNYIPSKVFIIISAENEIHVIVLKNELGSLPLILKKVFKNEFMLYSLKLLWKFLSVKWDFNKRNNVLII